MKKVKNMNFYANLHLHSTHSDGVYTPRELAEIVKKEGYGALAITDHDTASAYPELKAACEKLGLECIFGAEFSSTVPYDVHIVGFGFDPEYPPMKKYLADMAARQTDNTKKCFDEAVEKGNIVGVTWEEVLEFNQGVPWLCNNHVFNLLVARGIEKTDNYMNWFNKNFLHQRGKYPPVLRFLDNRELIALIKSAGGISVLAHPVKDGLDHLDALIEMGLDGVEVWHADMTQSERDRALKLALEKNLFISGGSDHSGLAGGFYSSYKTEEELKSSHLYVESGTFGTVREYFNEIKEKKLSRS